MLIALILVIVGCTSQPKDFGAQDVTVTEHRHPEHQENDALKGCEFMDSRNLPMVDNWEVVTVRRKVVDSNGMEFKWVFMYDPARPDVPVAGIIVGPINSSVPTRFSWQMGDKILTVRPATKEMICARPIKVIVENGKTIRLDLDHLRYKILGLL